MKGDIYYLVDPDGLVKAKFEHDSDCVMSGSCYQAVGWYSDNEVCDYDFFAKVYCKWGGCTHWDFYGEDYDEETEADSYYHICGTSCFRNHILIMCFIWYIAPIINAEIGITDLAQTEKYYNDDPVIEKLVGDMLEGYSLKIEKALPKKED